MVMLRLLLVFVFSTLLSSCQFAQDIKELKAYITGRTTENPCADSGPATAICYSVKTIIGDHYVNGLIKSKTANKVCEQNKASGNEYLDCTKFSPAERWISVKGSPTFEKGSDYEFYSQVTDPPTAELVCLRGSTSDPTGTQCAVRTTPLPIVQ